MRAWLKENFPAIDKSVDRFGYWPPFLVSLWGGMSWAASSMPSISQYGWGAVVFAGLGVVCILALVASVLMLAYRYLRPLEPNQIIRSADSVPENLKDHEDRFSRIDKALNDQSATMNGLFLESEANLSRVRESLEEQLAEAKTKIEYFKDSSRRDNEALAARLVALQTFYELDRLKKEMDRLIVLLERPLKLPKEDRDWAKWTVRFKKFERSIQAFATYAGRYYPNEASGLTYLRPANYRLADGDFAPENFPDPQTAHDFKSYRQMAVTYNDLGDGIIDRIRAKT